MASSTRKKSLVTGEENGGKAAQSGQEVPKKTATQLRQEKKVAMEKAAQEEAERISRKPSAFSGIAKLNIYFFSLRPATRSEGQSTEGCR